MTLTAPSSGRFKEILKKLGYRYEAGKVFDTDSNDAAPKTPVRAKSTTGKTGSASAKKRKASAEDADGEAGADAERALKAMKQEVKKEGAENNIDVATEAD